MNILNKRAWFAKHPKASIIIQRKDVVPVISMTWFQSDFVDKTLEGVELGDFVLCGSSGTATLHGPDPHLFLTVHVKAKDEITYISTYRRQAHLSVLGDFQPFEDQLLDTMVIPKEVADDIEDNNRPYWFMKNPKARLLSGSVTLGDNPGDLNDGVFGVSDLGDGPDWEFSQQKFFTKQIPVPGCKPGDFVLVSVDQDIGFASISAVAQTDVVYFKMYTNMNTDENYPLTDTLLTPSAKIRCLVIPNEAIPPLKKDHNGITLGDVMYDEFEPTPIYRFGGDNDIMISYGTHKFEEETTSTVTVSAALQAVYHMHTMNAKRSFNHDMSRIIADYTVDPYNATTTNSFGRTCFHLGSVNVPLVHMWDQGVDNYLTLTHGFWLCHGMQILPWQVNKFNGNAWGFTQTWVYVFNTLIDDNDPDNSPDWWRLYYEDNVEVTDREIYHRTLMINVPDDYSIEAKFIYGDYE